MLELHVNLKLLHYYSHSFNVLLWMKIHDLVPLNACLIRTWIDFFLRKSALHSWWVPFTMIEKQELHLFRDFTKFTITFQAIFRPRSYSALEYWEIGKLHFCFTTAFHISLLHELETPRTWYGKINSKCHKSISFFFCILNKFSYQCK